MPDRIDPPRFDRLIRRAKIAAWLLVGFIGLPVALIIAHRQ